MVGFCQGVSSLFDYQFSAHLTNKTAFPSRWRMPTWSSVIYVFLNKLGGTDGNSGKMIDNALVGRHQFCFHFFG